MSRDKQIEEMARDICECYNNDGTCYYDGKPCDLKCDCFTDAQYLYQKGYRKSTDHAEEIFAEIEKILDEKFSINHGVVLISKEEFAELKKKYTEGE
jgi:hypothetical protein